MARGSCGAEEARQTLPALLERARRGEVTLVTRHGKPCAAIVPFDAVAPEPRGASLLSLRGSGRGLWGDDPAVAVDAMRDEWA